MSHPIIEVKNLSKKYRIGQLGARTLREEAELLVNRFWKRNGHAVRPSKNQEPRTKNASDFWALRDVSFSVQPGEVVGIIGRNGAGKSTLLKILSRITEPTEGEAIIRGRVASLLEVGTGFHPELSGRENIYLNGAILGMKKTEIDRKFDEIVTFSGVEEFIDTPVKRYSSGMYVRLAFAVAAHLEPPILIVDEVLAVGDAEFQKRCLAKMQDISQHGRTVLFVSHSIGMINSLCRTSILLESGRITSAGPTAKVVLDYYTNGKSAPHDVDFEALAGEPPGDSTAKLLRGYVAQMDGKSTHELDIRQPFKIVMVFQLLKPVSAQGIPNFHFFDSRGEYAFVSFSRNYSCSGTMPGVYEAECCIPKDFLNDGHYGVGLALTFLGRGVHISFYERDALSFVVRDPIHETLENDRLGNCGPIPGVIRPKLDWNIRCIG